MYIRATGHVLKPTLGPRGLFDLMYLTDHEGDVVQESEDNSFCYRSPVAPAIYMEPGGVYPAVSHVGAHAFTPGVK